MFFSVEQRVEAFKKYYQKQNRRPLLGFFPCSEYPVEQYPASKSLPEGRPLKPDDFKWEPYIKNEENLYTLHEKCGGDFIWSASPFWGIPWLEVLLGCTIRVSQSTGSLYSEHPADFDTDKDIPAFDADNPWVKKAIEHIRLSAENSRGRYPIGIPRLRGVADLLSALYGEEKFIYAFFEDPDSLKRQCRGLADLWMDFAAHLLANIPPFHGGVGSFYYSMWAPADSVWHQEDAASLLNPDLYREYILPHDLEIARRFGGCFMHMHPTGFYPWRELADSDMTVLELHIDQGGPNAEALFDVHKGIMAKKPLLIWGEIPDQDLDWIFSKLPHEGLAVNTVVRDADHARQIWQKYIGDRPA